MKRCVLAPLGALLVVLSAAACGGSKPTAAAPSKAEPVSKGMSKDDQARCEFRGRADRDVSEGSAPGALTPNIRRVYQIVGEGSDKRKVLICREVDTNLDGVKDVVRTFNEKGEPLHEESDSNYDGKVDSWITFANGRVGMQAVDANADGKPDLWKYYTNGKLSRVQKDSNADGKPDVWEIYAMGHLERRGVDTDYDGHVDRWDRDEMARLTTETRDSESKGSSNADGGASSSSAKSEPESAASPTSDAGAAPKGKAGKAPASSGTAAARDAGSSN
jgi:hypothetical protein